MAEPNRVARPQTLLSDQHIGGAVSAEWPRVPRKPDPRGSVHENFDYNSRVPEHCHYCR